MNGEHTSKPDFIVVEDEQLEKGKPTESMENDVSSKVSEVTLEINEREAELILKQRYKLRLFNPKSVYFFRHIPVRNFHSSLHIISLFLSLFLFYILYKEINSAQLLFISGVGHVSNWNILDKGGTLFIIFFIIKKLEKLIFNKGQGFSNRYKIALCANTFNNIFYNCLKSYLVIFLFITLPLYFTDSSVSFEIINDRLTNGVFADNLSIFDWLVTLIIVVHGFRFFDKGFNE